MGKGTSLAVEVADQIRADIMAGRFVPGERLRVTPLCERFDVSTSVIREALTRLTSISLVLITPQCGFTVIHVDEVRILDVAAVRSEIEGTALQWAIKHGDADWEEGIKTALERLEQAEGRLVGEFGVTDEWAQVHSEFHSALASACDSPLLASLRRQLFDESELHRRWAYWGEGDGRDALAEHIMLAKAALERSPDLAAALMRRHIHKTKESVLRAWREGRIAAEHGPIRNIAV